LTSPQASGWQEIQDEILDRIFSRKWQPGELIPNEVELASEFGCARATVNRALQAVAEQGWIDRKRKAGTRVKEQPDRKAVLKIPVIRHEIEEKGQAYSYKLLSSRVEKPAVAVTDKMSLPDGAAILHLKAIHFGDDRPYVHEDRWINSLYLQQAEDVNFETQNANEWLLSNAPFTSGDFVFSATSADQELADVFGAERGDALFRFTRYTWNNDRSITMVKLTYAPGYRLKISG